MPEGIDDSAWMQPRVGRPDRLQTPAEAEDALGAAVEYLIEALDPALQAPAYQLVEALQAKLEQASR